MTVKRLDCQDVDREDLVEHYLADRLTDEDSEAFEVHFLTCERCQADLKAVAAVREVIAEGAASTPRRSPLPWLIPLAAAATVAALFLLPGSGPDAVLASLGGVGQAPIYLGLEVRSEEVPGEAGFEAGMAAYEERRWGDAVTALRAAREAGMEPLPGQFFLAAALLMDDRAAASAEAFQRVIELGDTPYEAEARFYRAKALLRLGEGRAALDDLDAAAVAEIPGLSVHARALADSVRLVLER